MSDNGKKWGQVVRERIAILISKAQTAIDNNDLDALRELGESENTWLYENASTPDTAKSTYFNEYQPAILKAFPVSEGEEIEDFEYIQRVKGVDTKRPILIKFIKPTQQQSDAYRDKKESTARKNANSKIPCYPSFYLDEITKIIGDEIANSKHPKRQGTKRETYSWAKLATAIIAATGRRPTELVWSADFKLVPESSYTLMFSGQLKTGDEELQDKEYEIYTLIDASLVYQAFQLMLKHPSVKKFRNGSQQEAKQGSNTTINTHFTNIFGRYVKSQLRADGTDNFTSQDARDLYGKIAEHLFCPDVSEGILFVGNILGHQLEKYKSSLDSLATTIHYRKYLIVDSNGKIDGRTGIKLGQPGVKTIPIDVSDELQVVKVKPVKTKTASITALPTDRVWLTQFQEKNNFPNQHSALNFVFEMVQMVFDNVGHDVPLDKDSLFDALFNPKTKMASEATNESTTESNIMDTTKTTENNNDVLNKIFEKFEALENRLQKLEQSPTSPITVTQIEPETKQIIKTPDAKASHAIDLIMQYNDKQSEKINQWYITQNGIIEISGNTISRNAIQRMLAERKPEIDKHHDKYKLIQKDNLSKRGLKTISKDITWDW
ncbi:hypothetical protein NIES2101_41885 [Calothrix sp. HK-06]|nr:hypothetical protein NIES2101_41885 [Calothrix sp. HK-06]